MENPLSLKEFRQNLIDETKNRVDGVMYRIEYKYGVTRLFIRSFSSKKRLEAIENLVKTSVNHHLETDDIDLQYVATIE